MLKYVGRITAACAVALIGLVSLNGTASAATCAEYALTNGVADFTGNVSPNSGCEVGSDIGNPGQNNDSEARVNSDGIFGATGTGVLDWAFIDKDETLPDGSGALQSTNVSTTSEPLTGEWSVSFGIFNQLLLVFKDGNADNIDTYVAYLLNVGQDSGSFTSMFVNNSNLKGISHISLYGRTNSNLNTVPVPAALPLMLTALGGLALLRRRRYTA